jgi:hypothetical protein
MRKLGKWLDTTGNRNKLKAGLYDKIICMGHFEQLAKKNQKYSSFKFINQILFTV